MGQKIDYAKLPLFESYCRKTQVDGKTIHAKVGDSVLKLKVASTPESQAAGYMKAADAPQEGTGILFVYDSAQPLSFWMKNVNFPLDLAFFDDEMKCIGHETMLPHQGEDDDLLTRYNSPGPARFALETTAGWCEKCLKKGDILSF